MSMEEQFHTLRMEEGTRISDNMRILNDIISDLDAIGVVISEEDKGLRLIWSFLISYELMKSILMYGKDTVIYSEVTIELLSKERRLDNNKNASIVENALVVRKGKKKNFGKVVC